MAANGVNIRQSNLKPLSKRSLTPHEHTRKCAENSNCKKIRTKNRKSKALNLFWRAEMRASLIQASTRGEESAENAERAVVFRAYQDANTWLTQKKTWNKKILQQQQLKTKHE